MKIGNKRLVYSQTFLIPKGDTVSGDIILNVSSHEPVSTLPKEIIIPTPGIALPLHIEILADHNPSAEDANRLKWRFETEPKASWFLTIYGPFSPIGSSTTEFSDFAILGGKKLGFWMSFSGSPHLCTVHIQLLMEE